MIQQPLHTAHTKIQGRRKYSDVQTSSLFTFHGDIARVYKLMPSRKGDIFI